MWIIMEENNCKEPERPFVANVEEYFSEFVDFYGGKIIEKLQENLVDRPNADYLFENPDIIAELKCFQKDVFSGEDEFPKIERLLNKWISKKKISNKQLRNYIFRGGALPKKCSEDIIELASKTIERAIYKANKQIEESKITLSKRNARGVLFLINDGNYFFNTKGFLGIISNLIRRKFITPSFDVVVYLTLNQATWKPGSELDHTFWIPIYMRIDENGNTVEDEELFYFINDIGKKFLNDFFTLKTGQLLLGTMQIENFEEGMEEISKHNYIPKEVIYKK
jgi:hypothetical protein